MTALFDIAAEYRAAAEKLADLDLDDQTLADTLESIGGDLQVKATNTAKVALSLESMAAQIKDAEAQMKRRREAMERRAAGIRRYLHDGMLAAGVQRIETPWFRLSIKTNPPAVEVFDASMVPVEFTKIPEPPPPAPDKTAIKAAIKAGIEVPGCRMTQGSRLDIA